MKRLLLPLFAFVITGLGIGYLFLSTLAGIKGLHNIEFMGWLNITGIGLGVSELGLLVLLFVFILAVLWLLLIVGWIAHLRNKNNEDVVRLP